MVPENTMSDVAETRTIYTCEFCSKVFSFKETVMFHKQNGHPKFTSPGYISMDYQVDAETIHTCEFCSKSFGSKKWVRLHKQNKHPTQARDGYARTRALNRQDQKPDK